jgi:hypothetical protein
VTFSDGSTIVVPRAWSGRVTDLAFDGALATALMQSTERIARLAHPAPAPSHQETCAQLEDIEINSVFYRSEPHLMRRYSALAFDNIRRDPAGFVEASAYRALRLFVIEGTGDPHTAQQFSKSGIVYTAATVVSSIYLLGFVAGAVIAWRRGYALLLPLALIAYVPLTISPVLTNMRYSITVQPLVFMFIAVGVIALLERLGVVQRRSAAAPDRAEK